VSTRFTEHNFNSLHAISYKFPLSDYFKLHCSQKKNHTTAIQLIYTLSLSVQDGPQTTLLDSSFSSCISSLLSTLLSSNAFPERSLVIVFLCGLVVSIVCQCWRHFFSLTVQANSIFLTFSWYTAGCWFIFRHCS